MTKHKRLLNLLVCILSICVLTFTPNKALAQQSTGNEQDGFSNFQTVTDTTFEQINPLRTTGSNQADNLSTPGGIISRVLEFAFPIAGLILFAMIVWGGFEVLMGAADKKSLDAGKQRITAAIIGFVLLFVSYWIIRVIEIVLGIKVIF